MNINTEAVDKTIDFINKQTAELVAAMKLNFDLQRKVEELGEDKAALERKVEELESLNEWKVCDENTPIDTELLLGWMQTWPSEKWESQISVYHCTRGRWIHCSATHYMSVPRAAVVLNSTKEPS